MLFSYAKLYAKTHLPHFDGVTAYTDFKKTLLFFSTIQEKKKNILKQSKYSQHMGLLAKKNGGHRKYVGPLRAAYI